MSTIVDPGYPTLLNVLKALSPDGSVESMIANTLTKKLPLLEDIPWVEGNLPTGDRVTSVLGLPSPNWRKTNQGVVPTKVETVQYDESCGMIDDFSKVDCAVADLSGNPAAYRAIQDKVKLESFNQTLESAVFYESVVAHPERIHGLTARYPATTGYTASAYVIKAGAPASANSQSIWLINWDPDRLCGIFPKGSRAGLQYEDLGKQLILDSNNLQFTGWVSHYVWKCGIRVKDYRYASRMQWDPSDTTNFPVVTPGKLLYLTMQQQLSTVYDMGPHARFYMSRTSYNELLKELAAASLNFLEYVAEGGKRIPMFMGVPIRVTDMLVGETAIS